MITDPGLVLPDNTDYPYNPPYAGFWRRLAAALVDSVIVGIAALVPGFIVGIVFGICMVAAPEEVRYGLRQLSSVVSGLSGALLAIGYYGYFESQQNGETLGRKALGIRLITESGLPITFGKSALRHLCRYLSGLILSIGYFIQVGSAKRQALHDSMTGTLVVRVREQATWVPWAINGAYGLLVVGFTALIFVVIAAVGVAAFSRFY
jgi:uncharacterized RDD family membrane protein YckC